ncbi:hypothetical protein F5Y05DRAFT_378943 [Hypoxylon sp. FL0543]|nr:hypothetical protein F5Y05DRAFT_378943 [Hypoxylon sp. FL0543]
MRCLVTTLAYVHYCMCTGDVPPAIVMPKLNELHGQAGNHFEPGWLVSDGVGLRWYSCGCQPSCTFEWNPYVRV